MAESILYDLAVEVLAGVEAAYTATGTTPPTRRYVAPGVVADDCPQLTVRLTRTFHGLPGNETARPEDCGGARSAAFEIRVNRCIKTSKDSGEASSPATLQGYAKDILEDGGALLYGLLRARHAGTFLSRCQSVRFGNIAISGPQGDMVALTLPLEVQVDG